MKYFLYLCIVRRENEDVDEKTRERRYFAAAAEVCKTIV